MSSDYSPNLQTFRLLTVIIDRSEHGSDHTLYLYFVLPNRYPSVLMILSVYIGYREASPPKKNSKCKKISKMGGVNPKFYIYLNLFSDKSTKSQKEILKSLHFDGGEGGRAKPIWKTLIFRFSRYIKNTKFTTFILRASIWFVFLSVHLL